MGRKGAGPKYNLEMALALKKEGYDVYACISKQAENANDYKKHNINHLSLNTYTGGVSALINSLRLPWLINEFKDYLKINRITHVYCTMPHIWNFFFSKRFKKLDISYLLTIHDAELHSGEENKLIDILMKKDRKNADGIVVLTKHVKEQLKNLGKSIFIIPHPAFSFNNNKNRAKSIVPDQKIKLLFFGRIHHYKGLDILIDAFEILNKKNNRYSLSIYGSGNISPYQKKILELSNITVHNRWIDDVEIPSIISSHDVCVIPYRDASQSGVIPTVMTCGVPLVVTPVAGLKEQVVHLQTAIFAEEVSSDSVARAIDSLVKDISLYEKISKNALLYAQEEMGWEKAAYRSVEALISITHNSKKYNQ